MDIERLVRMANQIGDFFAAYPNRTEAVNGIAQHLRNFWDPRMRKQIIDYVKQGDGNLKDIVREAIVSLADGEKPPS